MAVDPHRKELWRATGLSEAQVEANAQRIEDEELEDEPDMAAISAARLDDIRSMLFIVIGLLALLLWRVW